MHGSWGQALLVVVNLLVRNISSYVWLCGTCWKVLGEQRCPQRSKARQGYCEVGKVSVCVRTGAQAGCYSAETAGPLCLGGPPTLLPALLPFPSSTLRPVATWVSVCPVLAGWSAFLCPLDCCPSTKVTLPGQGYISPGDISRTHPKWAPNSP